MVRCSFFVIGDPMFAVPGQSEIIEMILPGACEAGDSIKPGA